jgi:hypothetical protein
VRAAYWVVVPAGTPAEADNREEAAMTAMFNTGTRVTPKCDKRTAAEQRWGTVVDPGERWFHWPEMQVAVHWDTMADRAFFVHLVGEVRAARTGE